MTSLRSTPPFDHGAALRVPPPEDSVNWRNLLKWLGDDARSVAEADAVQVRTPQGDVIAHCGDWIVLSVTGVFHVTHTGGRTWDA
jgi:hypothetical protein